MVVLDGPLFEEAIYSCGILSLRFVIALEAVLFVQRGILADVFDVD